MESFGYDSYPPEEASQDGLFKVQLKGHVTAGDLPSSRRYRFSLSDMIGMSSAAPMVLLSDYRIPNVLFPEFRHWAIDLDRERVHALSNLTAWSVMYAANDISEALAGAGLPPRE